MISLMTQDELKQVLHYDPDTGIFTQRGISVGRRTEGYVVGTATPHGYVSISVLGKRVLAHRLAFLYMTGEFPTEFVDHIDCKKGNNKWSNLRGCSKRQNGWNRGPTKLNTSGIKGVSFDKVHKQWVVRLQVDGKYKNYGRFPTLQEAAVVAQKEQLEHHGEFSNLSRDLV